MGAIIGELLPLAAGIALSPFPIIGAILVLRSAAGRAGGAGYLLGWVVGLVAVVLVIEVLGALLPGAGGGREGMLAGFIDIALGSLLLVLAWRKWRSRPRGDEESKTPRWMASVADVSAAGALRLGFLLAAANPKNVVLAVAAGVAVSAAGLPLGQAVTATAAFILLASATVIVAVVAALVAPRRMAGPLERMDAWLLRNSSVLLGVMLLIFGFVLIGDGIARF